MNALYGIGLLLLGAALIVAGQVERDTDDYQRQAEIKRLHHQGDIDGAFREAIRPPRSIPLTFGLPFVGSGCLTFGAALLLDILW